MAGVTEIVLNSVGLNFQTVLVAIVVFLVSYWYSHSDNLNLPPGPKGIPYFGDIPALMISDANKALENLRLVGKRYNSSVTHSILFGQYVVTLHTMDAIKQGYQTQGDEFDGRPGLLFQFLSKGYGLVASHGKLWKEQRRFALSTLRDFGMGKVDVEANINEEIYHMTNAMKEKAISAFRPYELFDVAVSNIICSICFGNRFEYTDKQFKHMLALFSMNSKLQGKSLALNFAPWLRNLPGDVFGFHKLLGIIDELCTFVKNRLDEHKTSFDEYNIRDYIDAYLAEMKKQQKLGNKDSSFTEIQLLYSVVDLFGAGSETTTTTLRWAILLMILNPDVQQTVQDEIDVEIPRSRTPRMPDRSKLPYTMATLCEIQRFASIVPASAPHCATQDTKLYGYDIPKGSVVLSLTYAVHRDETIWKSPHKFDPNNFLDEKQNLINQDYLIPFGVGKRACLGESLAKMELFLFFTAMLQKFRFTVDPDKPKPGLGREIGIVHSPKDHYTVLAESRN